MKYSKSGLPIESIIASYTEGATTTTIAIKYGCAPSTINRLLKRENVRLRPSSYRKYGLEVPESINIEDCDAYWIGFFLADGCICKKGSCIINLQLADSCHLKKFRDWLKSSHPIRLYKNHCRISIKCKKLEQYFKSFGIVSAKSLIAKPCDKLLHNRHFWRGLVDGDGSILVRKDGYACIALTGTKEIVEEFSKFAAKTTGSGYNISKRTGQNHYTFQLVGTRAVQLINFLYRENDIALERKMTNAQRINKKLRNKSNHKTTRSGPRGNRRFNHGVSKDSSKSRQRKKLR